MSNFVKTIIFYQKYKKSTIQAVFGGRSGNRTHTPLLELDFESGASTNSAIRPLYYSTIKPIFLIIVLLDAIFNVIIKT